MLHLHATPLKSKPFLFCHQPPVSFIKPVKGSIEFSGGVVGLVWGNLPLTAPMRKKNNRQELVSRPPYHVRLCCQGFHHSSMMLLQEFHHVSNICATILLPIWDSEVHFGKNWERWTIIYILYIYIYLSDWSSLLPFFVGRFAHSLFAASKGRFLAPPVRDQTRRDEVARTIIFSPPNKKHPPPCSTWHLPGEETVGETETLQLQSAANLSQQKRILYIGEKTSPPTSTKIGVLVNTPGF